MFGQCASEWLYSWGIFCYRNLSSTWMKMRSWPMEVWHWTTRISTIQSTTVMMKTTTCLMVMYSGEFSQSLNNGIFGVGLPHKEMYNWNLYLLSVNSQVRKRATFWWWTLYQTRNLWRWHPRWWQIQEQKGMDWWDNCWIQEEESRVQEREGWAVWNCCQAWLRAPEFYEVDDQPKTYGWR